MSSRESNAPDPVIQDQERGESELHELVDSIILEFKQSRQTSTLDTAIFLRQVLGQRSPPHPLRSDALRHLSIASLTRFLQWDWKMDSDEAFMPMMEASQETIKVITQMPANILGFRDNDITAQIGSFHHEAQAEAMQLAVTSLIEFCQPVESSSINTAIHLFNNFLLSRSPTNPNRSHTLFNSSDVLVMPFHVTGQLTDLDDGILQLREAKHLRSPPDPVRHLQIMSLSAALCMRFSWSGLPQEIFEAISIWIEVDKVDEEARESLSLGTEMLDVFNQSGALSDLDTSMVFLCTSLWLRPAPHPHPSGSLNNLARAPLTRFQQKGQLADLNESFALNREALALRPAPHPHQSASLNNLPSVLSTRFQQKGQLADLEESITFLREELVLFPAPHPHRSGSLNNLSNALSRRFQLKVQLTDLEECIAFHRQALALTPAPHPDRSDSLINLLNALSTRFQQKGHLADLDIAFHREALLLTPAPHPHRSASLSNLAYALLARFQQKGQLADLEESIALNREALALRPAPHSHRSASLNNLAYALLRRFEQKGQLADLEESIALNREALVLFPERHPRQSGSLINLALALLRRFEQKGQLTDLEESIALNREALVLFPAPHPHPSVSLINLASALLRRFEQKGQVTDLEESIALKREALVLFPAGCRNCKAAPHPHRSGSLGNLANALLMRFHQRGQLADLEESIIVNREALFLRPAPHPYRSDSLSSLANGLSERFKQKGQLADLEESIAFLQEALVLIPAPHPRRSTSLDILGSALSTRFLQKGQLADLEESIALKREALALRPAPHPDRSISLNGLSNVLSIRFEQKGQLADLEESIAFHRQALVLRPASHPDRSASLSNLAIALLMRFNQRGQFADLEESIALNREALVLRPAPHPHRSTLFNNLANVLSRRFKQKGQLADLEESLACHREALVLFPARHPHRSGSLMNLAYALSMRFKQKGQLADLEESIALNREALVLFPASHTHRSNSLSSLAYALWRRFKQKGQLADLEESIALNREALLLRPAPHPDRSVSLNHLASELSTRYQQKGQLADLEESMTSFSEASKHETAPVINRFRYSRRWAHRAASVRHSSAMQAYQYTINLLPRLASLDLNIQQRQEALNHARGLACNACSYAIREGYFDKAVEFLSAGRAVFWAQALQLRTPIDNLQSHAPQLADKLRTIALALETASARDSSRTTLDNSRQIRDLEKEAIRCRILNDDWNHTLEEVRKLKGFDDFLLPKSISKLKKASYNGPVVMLNATTSGCDALVLMQDRVKHIPFPNISIQVIHDLGVLTQKALSSNSVRSDMSALVDGVLQSIPEAIRAGHRHGGPIPNTHYTPQDLFEVILSTLWLTVARPIIHGLNIKVKHDLTRIWWCPAGLFSFLPIHAAGIFQGDHQECLSDYAISSYTPTLDALLHSPPPKFYEAKMLVVIQPEMPGNYSRNLPYTIKELDMIERHVPQTFLTKLGAEKAPTSVEMVLSHLSDTSFAHFACHGLQNLVNPLDSALLLGDEHLKVSNIMQHAIPNASLAFLSACETAMGDKNAPDEAMHLAATMLFAGFRGVVGTMWSIYDEDAPEVVNAFYHHIFGTGQEHPDATTAAEALHIAVVKLRKEKKVSFQRWIPFIHLGL